MMRSSKPSPLISPAEETKAGKIVRIRAVDHEAANAGGNVHKIDCRPEPAGFSEHHIAVAGIGARSRRRAGTVGRARSNDNVVEAVAIDVPGRGNRLACPIERIHAVDHESADARFDVHQIDRRAEPAGLAKYHIASAGIVAGAGRRAGTVGPVSADDKVVEAITVDVSGGGDRRAGLVVRIRPMDHEAADARGDVHEIDRCRKARSAAEHHIAVAGSGARARRRAGAVGIRRPNDEIIEAIAIHVPGRGN